MIAESFIGVSELLRIAYVIVDQRLVRRYSKLEKTYWYLPRSQMESYHSLKSTFYLPIIMQQLKIIDRSLP